MDRTKTDTIIGIVGAVAIVFTLVGVFAYEYSNAPNSTDEGEENMAPPKASDSDEGSLSADESASVSLIPDEGVRTMTITIDWTPAVEPAGPVDAGSAYSYTITDPDGVQLDQGSLTTGHSFDVESPISGEYTVTITINNPSQGGDFRVTGAYTY